jgi:hypothetical protein
VDLTRAAVAADELRRLKEGRARLPVVRGGAIWSASGDHARAQVSVIGGVPAREARVVAARYAGRDVQLAVDLETLRPGNPKQVRIPLEREMEGLPHAIELRVSWVDDAGPHEEWFEAEAPA